MRLRQLSCFFFVVFSLSLASAGLFTDVFGSITGGVIAEIDSNNESEVVGYLGNVSCNFLRGVLEQSSINYEIPEKIPFSTDVFTIFVDEGFMISIEIKDKKVKGIYCEVPEGTTYNVYISSKLLVNATTNYQEINPIDFYNDNRKSGDLKIKPVGIKRKFKMFFINIGLKFASLFS